MSKNFANDCDLSVSGRLLVSGLGWYNVGLTEQVAGDGDREGLNPLASLYFVTT